MKKGFSDFASLSNFIATMKQAIIAGNASNETQNSVQYMTLGYAGRGNAFYQPSDHSVPNDGNNSQAMMFGQTGVLKNLYVQIDQDNASVGTYNFTIMKNGVATALTVSGVPTASGNAALYTDLAHSAVVAPSDLFSIQKDTMGTDASFGGFLLAVEFDPA